MLELNRIYNCDCLEGLRNMDNESVELTVTSPPYDMLRNYHESLDSETWNFGVFKPIARELYRVTKKGGIVVWVVGDAVVNGSETGSSFRQALYMMDCGFKLHDTMIYEKNSSSFPARRDSKRYSQIFEYMFIFVKGKIRKDIMLIADKRNKWFGWTNWGQHSQYDTSGNLKKTRNIKPIPEYSLRNNIWRYTVSFNDKTGHPAVFPEKLAQDNILSWSVEGDTVLDPFMGSGTTAKMAILNARNYIGFEKNKVYYEESLKRIEKYANLKNEEQSTVLIGTPDGEFQELQCNENADNDIEEKTELFNKLVDDMNNYFNEQPLELLRNLKLVFSSKDNDKRVKKVLEEVANADKEIT